MVKIVVDSGCDYNDALITEKSIPIELVPLTLQLADKKYVDDESLDIATYLEDMEQCPESAKTAAPSPELFMDKFKGMEKVFAVTLSQYMSGSYNSAMLAKELYFDEFGQKCIHVFDSLSASVGETVIALKINELVQKNLPDNEMIESVNRFIANMKTYFILDKYDNLVKTGRINPYIAKLASLLSIRPICIADGGKIAFVDKARGFDKAMDKLVDIMAKEKVDFKDRTLGIAHVKCLEKALNLQKAVVGRIPFKEIFIVEARGISATYANKGGIILSY